MSNMNDAPTNPDRRLAAEIRGEMARRGVTQKALAAKVGLTHRQLHNRLRGAAPIAYSEVLAIAAALEVPASSLIARAEGSAA